MNIYSSSLDFDSMTKRKKTDLIVLHHAAAKKCSVEDAHSWHKKKGYAGIGYHFLIRKDGTIWRGRPEDRTGAHTVNYNSRSIGICFEGNFETESMPDIQKQAGLELIAYIKGKYPIEEIKGHGELRNTACPGKKFPLDEMKGIKAEPPKENRALKFQQAAIADGFKLPKFGADGVWGTETESVAKTAIVKRRLTYKYKNLTRLVQYAVGVTVDGLCGKDTTNAIRRWQKENGLVVDGQWGINCWNKWRVEK